MDTPLPDAQFYACGTNAGRSDTDVGRHSASLITSRAPSPTVSSFLLRIFEITKVLEQSLFDEPAPRVYRWEWWHDFPVHFTARQCQLAQIARDMRALEEVVAEWPDDAESAEFFRGRIARMRATIKNEDDCRRAQNTPTIVLDAESEDLAFF